MQDTKKAQELFSQLTGKAVETMTVWAEPTSGCCGSWWSLGAGAAKEGVRLYAELQQSAIEAMRESQAARCGGRRAGRTRRDPLAWYQRVTDGVRERPEVVPHAGGATPRSLTRTAERLQASRAGRQGHPGVVGRRDVG